MGFQWAIRGKLSAQKHANFKKGTVMARIFSSVGVKQQLGKRIRQLRMSRGWSQEVLAELAGLHRNYIGHVERVEVNAGLMNLEKIAQAFEISVQELLNMDDLEAAARDGGSAG